MPSLTTSPHAAPDELIIYAGLCGWTLARAHARSGDRVQIAGYLGKSERFDRTVADFAEAYADQTERDHAALCAAVKWGRIPADAGAWENQRRRKRGRVSIVKRRRSGTSRLRVLASNQTEEGRTWRHRGLLF